MEDLEESRAYLAQLIRRGVWANLKPRQKAIAVSCSFFRWLKFVSARRDWLESLVAVSKRVRRIELTSAAPRTNLVLIRFRIELADVRARLKRSSQLKSMIARKDRGVPTTLASGLLGLQWQAVRLPYNVSTSALQSPASASRPLRQYLDHACI